MASGPAPSDQDVPPAACRPSPGGRVAMSGLVTACGLAGLACLRSAVADTLLTEMDLLVASLFPLAPFLGAFAGSAVVDGGRAYRPWLVGATALAGAMVGFVAGGPIGPSPRPVDFVPFAAATFAGALLGTLARRPPGRGAPSRAVGLMLLLLVLVLLLLPALLRAA